VIKRIIVCDCCGKKLRELGGMEIVKEPSKEDLCTLCTEEKKLLVCPRCKSANVKKVKGWRKDFSDWECGDCGEIWLDPNQQFEKFDSELFIDDYCPDSSW